MNEIGDKEMIDTVSRVNAIIRSSEKINLVRTKYTEGAIVAIEQDKRAEFIADILYLLHGARLNA